MLLNRCTIKTYKFGEFGKEDITILEKMINHIKKNKDMYAKLVVMVALLLHYNRSYVFANSLEASLDDTFGN